MIAQRWSPISVLLGVLTSAVATGIVLVSDRGISFADESDYLALSTNLARSGWFSMNGATSTAFRPPGFPLVLSAVARFLPELTALRVANAILAGIVVVLGARLAHMIAGSFTAVLTAVLLTLSPVALYTSTKLYPQSLAALLILVGLLATVRLRAEVDPRRRLWWSAGGGLAFAMLTLTVPNLGITFVVATLWIIWRLRRMALVPLAVLFVCFLLPVGAWTVRNYVVFHEVVPVSTNGGINLLLGNTAGAGAGTGTDVDISRYLVEAKRQHLNEVEQDRFLQDQGLGWIRQHPARAAQLYAAKFLNTFTVKEELTTRNQQPSMATTVLLAATYLPVLLLFLIRPLFRARVPFRTGEGLLILVFWANVAVTALAFTRIRFRVPIDPLMVIVVATFVAGLLDRSDSAGTPTRLVSGARPVADETIVVNPEASG